MLALVSSSTASAIGCCTFEKKVVSCLTPSSKISMSPCSRSVTNRLPSVTVTFKDTRSIPPRNGVCADPCPDPCDGAGAGVCAAGGAGVCAASSAAAESTPAIPKVVSARAGIDSALAHPRARSHGHVRLRRRHRDLLGRDQFFRTAVGHDVLVQELV